MIKKTLIITLIVLLFFNLLIPSTITARAEEEIKSTALMASYVKVNWTHQNEPIMPIDDLKYYPIKIDYSVTLAPLGRLFLPFFVGRQIAIKLTIIDSNPWLKDVLVPGEKYYNPKVWNNYPPGENGNYSNVGFILLGYLIEQLTNQSFEKYCQDNILTPLQMQNTSFHPDTLDKDQLATPYVRILRFYIPLRHYDYNYVTAAGGIRSTLEDLSHFLLAHMNDGEYNDVRILEEETVELMHTIQYTNSRYGLGWIVNSKDNGRTLEGHTGGAPGGTALMMMSTFENIGVIFFINYYRDFYHPLEAFAWSKLKEMLFQKAFEL